MQEKYELRIMLTDSKAINILKEINNYGLKRKLIENAIIKFAKGNGKIQIDLYGQSHKKGLRVSHKEKKSEAKEVLPQNREQQVALLEKEIPQPKRLEAKQEKKKKKRKQQKIKVALCLILGAINVS